MDGDEARPLELLHQAARRLDAAVCLTSSADLRDTATGARSRTHQAGATLRRLAVVRPQTNASSRWDALERGQILAAHPVTDTARLDDVASLLLIVLAPLVNA